MLLNWSKFNSPFKARYIKDKVPVSPGIYVLYVLFENDKWECFYVGNSDNLHDTLMQHLTEQENPKISENINDYICGFEYATLEFEDERAGVSKYLFDKLKPEAMVDPGGKGIRVNHTKVRGV